MNTRSPDRLARPGDASRLFGLFSALFALSLILHELWWFGFEARSPHLVVVLAALWAIFRPASVARFLTLTAAEVVAVGLDMPDVGSHTLVVLVSGACVLAYAGWTILRTRRMPEAGALFARIAPFLRVALLLVYATAAIAKLNTGFFDAHASCAAALSKQVAWFDPALLDGAWRIVPAIWGTLAIEISLPVLLAVPRTRLIGLALGAGFHTILALAGNVPFSALALALYVPFLPADTPSRLGALVGERPWLARWARRARRLGGSGASFPVAAGSWLVAAALFGGDPVTERAVIAHGTRLLVVVVALGAAILLALCFRRGGGPTPSPGSLRLGHPVFVAGIAVLAANSLSPYVGLKTESSLTMFSNLQTEAGHWNHVLIPESVRVFAYQDQLVRITASNDRALEARTRNGTRLERFELERYLRLHPGTSAAYATAGTAGTTRITGGDSAAPPVTTLLDRLVKFQDVRARGRSGC